MLVWWRCLLLHAPANTREGPRMNTKHLLADESLLSTARLRLSHGCVLVALLGSGHQEGLCQVDTGPLAQAAGTGNSYLSYSAAAMSL